MARCGMDPQVGRQFFRALIELDPSGIVQPDHAADVVDLEGVPELGIAGIAAGGVLHLLFLQVEACLRKLGEVVGHAIGNRR